MTKLLTLLTVLASATAFAQNKPAGATTGNTKTTTVSANAGSVMKDGEEIFTFVEQMPDPGFNVNEYLSANLKYPEDARLNNISGKVVVKFVIDEHGFVRRPEVVKSVYRSLDSTAIAVVKKMPRWKPGISAGKPVKVYFTLPINFKLEEPVKKNEPYGGR